MSKILPFEFNDPAVNPSDPGLKFVMFRLERDGQFLGFEWGMANFYEDGSFETLSSDGVTARVVQWAALPNPVNLF